MKHLCIATSLTTTAILILSCCLPADSLAAQGTGDRKSRWIKLVEYFHNLAAGTRQGLLRGCRMARPTLEELEPGKAHG